ncbi:MAG TPA: sigma-70 factor domain-containing protein, partial [Aquabacterium sp.]|nr:sigma-70 factor domain-containing protein [Aquabacterium sp.]
MTLTTALAPRDPWSVVPSLGNLDAYIRSVQAIPMLEADEEQALARRLRDQQDL